MHDIKVKMAEKLCVQADKLILSGCDDNANAQNILCPFPGEVCRLCGKAQTRSQNTRETQHRPIPNEPPIKHKKT